MPTEFDIQYALENTEVLHEPDRRIDTFGSTQFEFQIVTELMDTIGAVRVREGRIEAEKPLILRPEMPGNFDFEGFGPEAAAFGDFLRNNLHKLAILKYGFKFRKGEITEQIVHESMENVCGRLLGDIRASGNPMRAVIQGVDDTWEICLLKFTVEMIEKSQNINLFDFKRRGLLG
ncbi:MAG: hypothetical protein JNM65_03140 [Verrucomicrobiaceae bacterium]|nr:hypothetical protein [Verrucomicrobiaceae bacterium]